MPAVAENLTMPRGSENKKIKAAKNRKAQKKLQPIVKVTAAVMETDGRIIIAQRKSTDHLAGKWELPGGKVEPGETPEQCLQRELKEEFDIDVRVDDYLGASIYHYEHLSIELMAYRTYWSGGRIRAKDHADYRWVTPAELGQYDFAPADRPFVQRIRSGEIKL
jgi:8-oxo-dGTP diphosphatase